MADPNSTGALPRRLRALFTERTAAVDEIEILTTEDDQELAGAREEENTRRKVLAGTAVLYRALERLGLIPWLRRVLDTGLTRAYDRSMFRLADDGPLIPAEDWEGWPDTRPVEKTLPKAPPKRLSPGRRRARLAYLKTRLAVIDTKLDDLFKKYTPHRNKKNEQREILVGAVVLQLSFQNERVRRWLRRLLDRRYTAVKDRKLFLLEDGGPLVPAEDQAGLGLNQRQPAKMRVSDGHSPVAGGKARRPPSASTGTSDRDAAGGSGHAGTIRAREPDRAGDEAVTHDVSEPIPGWQPHRLPAESACVSGVRTRRSAWGARLTGRAAVAGLPADLLGRRIEVTDSNLTSWTTTITGVVSRDEGRVTVRNSGRPGRETGSAHSEEPGSSSS